MGALLEYKTVPLGISCADEDFNPSCVILRSPTDIYIDVYPLRSAGVSQDISPSQYATIFVLGVPPPTIVPTCLSLTKVHESGIS